MLFGAKGFGAAVAAAGALTAVFWRQLAPARYSGRPEPAAPASDVPDAQEPTAEVAELSATDRQPLIRYTTEPAPQHATPHPTRYPIQPVAQPVPPHPTRPLARPVPQHAMQSLTPSVPEHPARPPAPSVPQAAPPHATEPLMRDHMPPTGKAAADGFPVLGKRSRAFRAPWLLPETPAPHGLVADQAVLGGLVVRAASVVGPGHRGRGVARQDAYRVGRDRAGRHLVIAVADGMSDSRHSDVGAQVAVSALVNTLRAALDSGTAIHALNHREVFLAAARQMYAVAEQRGWTADDVRAVAVAAVVPAVPHVTGVREVWLGSIADVSAWRLCAGEWDRLIGDEKPGYDSSVAHFLPHDPDNVAFGRIELPRGSVLAVTTDGLADAFATGPDARRWFAERWAHPPGIGAFLMDVGYEQTQMHDDRTAVVVWCADEEQGG
ncbi:protein phosphatase 2C domain-containing protein [Streptomyces sp. NBC_01142]|uniref:protein phosphatase 2C domain-containing protein n=1 Tax=Streptomyces sp. NBC_01142 TaxID=2975865 RepID=UPI002252A289|nr:protein phosphatase 2C domain-containing protein [Streptomyces sp. NBC_01142]MCX4822175.1 protein phosphatase 2C domain-containing protein [Streptomyces sp. NBC_01142]